MSASVDAGNETLRRLLERSGLSRDETGTENPIGSVSPVVALRDDTLPPALDWSLHDPLHPYPCPDP